MNNNYISPMESFGSQPSPLCTLRQSNQTSLTNGHVYEPGMFTHPRSKLDKYTRRTSDEAPPATRSVSYLTIPDIRLEPPPNDDPYLESAQALNGDMRQKMADILGRIQAVYVEDQTTDVVTLPGRYTRLLSGTSQRRELNSTEEDIQTRESDLSTALKWIRQEILYMKHQDTCLFQQFAHLHDSILQLRGLYDANSSCSDISSLDGSTYSLNEQTRSPRLRRLVQDGSQFSNKPSVSLPSSPRVSRLKWDGHDIV